MFIYISFYDPYTVAHASGSQWSLPNSSTSVRQGSLLYVAEEPHPVHRPAGNLIKILSHRGRLHLYELESKNTIASDMKELVGYAA